MSNSEKQTDKSAFQESGFGKSLEGGQEIKTFILVSSLQDMIEFSRDMDDTNSKTPPGDPLTTQP